MMKSEKIEINKVLENAKKNNTRISDELSEYFGVLENFSIFVGDGEEYQNAQDYAMLESQWLNFNSDYAADLAVRAMIVVPIARFELSHNYISDRMRDELCGSYLDIKDGVFDAMPSDYRDVIINELQILFNYFENEVE